MKNLLKSAVVLATVVAPAAALSTNASAVTLPKIYLPSCSGVKLQVPPAETLSCKSHTYYIGQLVWKTWTLTSATASGTLYSKGTKTMGTYTFSGSTTYKKNKFFTMVSGPGLTGATSLIKP
jgi:hypothetical protein